MKHNLELMTHYGEEDDNEAGNSISSVDDSNEENEYFETKPRKINFDDVENGGQHFDGNDGAERIAPKQKRKKLLGDELQKNLVCDICNKSFEKRWALNGHMTLHSGYL